MITQTSEGALLTIIVQPRAAKTEYVGPHGEALKFRISAPPVDGAANQALCRFLAELFSLPKHSVSVCSGHEARKKRVLLKGITASQVQKILSETEP